LSLPSSNACSSGAAFEKLDREISQLELRLEELQTTAAARTLPAQSSGPQPQAPVRRPLPAHLPRQEVVHQPPGCCPDCGSEIRRIGEDVPEVLDYVPARFRVIRHVRPKRA
jgi:transposase